MWLHYALAASILWGLDYSLNGRLLEYIQPQTLMLIQLGLGFLVYFIFVVFFQPKIQLSVDLKWLLKNKAFFGLVILTVSTYLIADFCIFQSIRFKNPAIAAMIETSYPVFTLFFIVQTKFFKFKILCWRRFNRFRCNHFKLHLINIMAALMRCFHLVFLPAQEDWL
jgi:drug/metabolite transporter (DMT)-like permease